MERFDPEGTTTLLALDETFASLPRDAGAQ
jgi:hypothetical protein